MLLCAPGRNETAACAWVGCQTRWGAWKLVPAMDRVQQGAAAGAWAMSGL